MEGSEGRKKSRVRGMVAQRPAGVHIVLAPLGGFLVAFRGHLGKHHYSFARKGAPEELWGLLGDVFGILMLAKL